MHREFPGFSRASEPPSDASALARDAPSQELSDGVLHVSRIAFVRWQMQIIQFFPLKRTNNPVFTVGANEHVLVYPQRSKDSDTKPQQSKNPGAADRHFWARQRPNLLTCLQRLQQSKNVRCRPAENVSYVTASATEEAHVSTRRDDVSRVGQPNRSGRHRSGPRR